MAGFAGGLVTGLATGAAGLVLLAALTAPPVAEAPAPVAAVPAPADAATGAAPAAPDTPAMPALSEAAVAPQTPPAPPQPQADPDDAAPPPTVPPLVMARPETAAPRHDAISVPAPSAFDLAAASGAEGAAESTAADSRPADVTTGEGADASPVIGGDEAVGEVSASPEQVAAPAGDVPSAPAASLEANDTGAPGLSMAEESAPAGLDDMAAAEDGEESEAGRDEDPTGLGSAEVEKADAPEDPVQPAEPQDGTAGLAATPAAAGPNDIASLDGVEAGGAGGPSATEPLGRPEGESIGQRDEADTPAATDPGVEPDSGSVMENEDGAGSDLMETEAGGKADISAIPDQPEQLEDQVAGQIDVVDTLAAPASNGESDNDGAGLAIVEVENAGGADISAVTELPDQSGSEAAEPSDEADMLSATGPGVQPDGAGGRGASPAPEEATAAMDEPPTTPSQATPVQPAAAASTAAPLAAPGPRWRYPAPDLSIPPGIADLFTPSSRIGGQN